MKINNKETLILLAENKYNYPRKKNIQVMKENMAIELQIVSNKFKTNNDTKFKY